MKQIRITKTDQQTYKFQDCDNNKSIYYTKDESGDDIYLTRLLQLIDDFELWTRNKSKLIGTMNGLQKIDDSYLIYM